MHALRIITIGALGFISCAPLSATLSEEPGTLTIESFIGTDPGYGNGQHTVIAPATGQAAITFPIRDLPPGLITLSFRVYQPDSGEAPSWSATTSRNLIVTDFPGGNPLAQIEAFFDDDPGTGFGLPFALPENSGGEIRQLMKTFDLASLSEGLHVLSIRARATDGPWGMLSQHLLLVLGGANLYWDTEIIGAEIFANTDPGHGHATTLPLNSANAAAISPDLLLPLLHPGLNVVGLRVQDNTGRWSVTTHRLVRLLAAPPEDPVVEHLVYRIMEKPSVSGTATLKDFVSSGTVSATIASANQLQPDVNYQLGLTPVDSAGRTGQEVFVSFTAREPYTMWLGRHFDSQEINEGVLTDSQADPDGDGIPNFAEFAFGLDPRTPAPLPALTLHEAESTQEGTRLIFTYPRNPDARHFHWTFPATPDLRGPWTPAGAEELSVTPVDSETELVTVRETSASADSRHFIRVEVSEPEP